MAKPDPGMTPLWELANQRPHSRGVLKEEDILSDLLYYSALYEPFLG